MTRSRLSTVIQLSPLQKILALFLPADKAHIQSELALPQYVSMLGTRFHQVSIEPALWALTLQVNKERWCFLAYLEEHQTGPQYLVCTHGFKKAPGPIPRSELVEAVRLYQLSQQMGGV